jgi:hypothetical protein
MNPMNIQFVLRPDILLSTCQITQQSSNKSCGVILIFATVWFALRATLLLRVLRQLVIRHFYCKSIALCKFQSPLNDSKSHFTRGSDCNFWACFPCEFYRQTFMNLDVRLFYHTSITTCDYWFKAYINEARNNILHCVWLQSYGGESVNRS